MKKKRSIIPVVFLSSSILLFCCSPGQKAKQEPKNAAAAKTAASAGAGASASGQQGVESQSNLVARRGLGRNAAGSGGRGRSRYSAVLITPEERDALKIKTVKASYRPIQSLHTAMGKVLAPLPRMARVSYAFPARIAVIHVQIGDWVKKGQPVLTLQSQEVGQAKCEYYKAMADCELAKTNYEREKVLFSRGVGAQKNTLAAEAEYKVAQTNLDAAEKKLHVLGFTEEDVKSIAGTHQINPEITLLAPLSGKIIEHKAILGQMIDQSTELLTIMDPTVLWVDAEIFERDIAKIRIGQVVSISLPAYPGQTFGGKLSYISDLLKEDTRTITVRTEVENKDFKLKPGMFADMTIHLNQAQRALTVPEEAILDDNDDQIIFVKVDGQYVPRILEVGTRQNGYCEVTSGVKEGEEVVTAGNFQLKSKLYSELLKMSGVH